LKPKASEECSYGSTLTNYSLQSATGKKQKMKKKKLELQSTRLQELIEELESHMASSKPLSAEEILEYLRMKLLTNTTL